MGYIFDPDKLHHMAQRVVGMPREQLITQLVSDIAEAYPGYISTKQNWIFNLAGGATGSMMVLHGSLTEYLIIFGSSIGTEGYSGRYRLDIHDYMLDGEMWVYVGDRPTERITYKPGDHAKLPRGMTKAWKSPENAWMLEYGRGNVPSCLPVGLGGAVFSAVEPKIVWDTVKEYGGQTIRNLLKGKF